MNKASRKKTAKRAARASTKETVRSAAKKPKGATRIIVFACSWYPSIAADNAGVVGLEYSADVRILTLACAGRLTPSLVLDAFGAGAAGVLVAACKPELCHHVNGSSICERTVAETRELAELLGIGAERVLLETFDSEKGEPFVESVESFRKRVGKLKPFVVEQ
ncbi:MAG: hydrogenase iron-sulfur subunit [Candidatus Eiseniibacteriota bacterium]|nr:MAG: hydrogenase iron-sulfur subunit [Candidatus Eisenbacteria bacterium]